MKSVKYLIMSLVLILPIALFAFAEEAKQAAKPEAGAETKQDVKTEAVPAVGAKQDAEHKHEMGTEKRVVATIGADGVQRVEVIGGEYYFDPNYIVVKVNKPVELKLKKAAGYVPHDIVVKSPEAGIDFKIDMKSDPVPVTFTPTKVGKYPMYCDKSLLWFKTHREKGMEGIIEVVE